MKEVIKISQTVEALNRAFKRGNVKIVTPQIAHEYAFDRVSDKNGLVDTQAHSLRTSIHTYAHIGTDKVVTGYRDEEGFHVKSNVANVPKGQQVCMVIHTVDGEYKQILVTSQSLFDEIKAIQPGTRAGGGNSGKRSKGMYDIENPSSVSETLSSQYEGFHAMAARDKLDDAPITGIRKSDKSQEIVQPKFREFLAKDGEDLEVPGIGLFVRKFKVQVPEGQKERYEMSLKIKELKEKADHEAEVLKSQKQPYEEEIAAIRKKMEAEIEKVEEQMYNDNKVYKALANKEKAEKTLQEKIAEFNAIGKNSDE